MQEWLFTHFMTCVLNSQEWLWYVAHSTSLLPVENLATMLAACWIQREDYAVLVLPGYLLSQPLVLWALWLCTMECNATLKRGGDWHRFILKREECLVGNYRRKMEAFWVALFPANKGFGFFEPICLKWGRTRKDQLSRPHTFNFFPPYL